jgi:hypothetical protein
MKSPSELSEDLHPSVFHRCANQPRHNYYGAGAGGPGNNAESPVSQGLLHLMTQQDSMQRAAHMQTKRDYAKKIVGSQSRAPIIHQEIVGGQPNPVGISMPQIAGAKNSAQVRQ